MKIKNYKKEIEGILKTINNLVGYRDYDKNLMKDLVEEAYNLGFRNGIESTQDKEIIEGLSSALEDVKNGRYTILTNEKGVKNE